MVTLMASSVTHEMLTPLKCIISFAKSLTSQLKHYESQRKAVELISVTANLILYQMKMLLDENMLCANTFTL